MKTILITIGTSLALIGVSNAAAQSSENDTAFVPRGAEARLSLIVPFGGDTRNAKSKPQLALVSRQYRAEKSSTRWALRASGEAGGFVESRFALTLSRQPEFLLNDQIILRADADQAGVSDDVKTVGKVALGAGLIVAVAGVVVLGVVAACHGDGEDAKC